MQARIKVARDHYKVALDDGEESSWEPLSMLGLFLIAWQQDKLAGSFAINKPYPTEITLEAI